jgi:hypothetical protein
MTLFEFLKTKFSTCYVSSENGMVCVKSGDEVLIQHKYQFEIWQTNRVGFFSFEIGIIIVHLPDPELLDYNAEVMLLISQILTNRGFVSNYRTDFLKSPVLFVQVETPETLEICVSHLGRMRFSTRNRKPTYKFTENDVVSLSKFFDDPENYRFGRNAIYCWNKETKTLYEDYQSKLFTAGPCETPDNSLFANITWEIYRFRCHVQEMRILRIGCLTEDMMAAHMKKAYNTSDRLESANKKQIEDFCNVHHEILRPISLQANDFPDVEEEETSSQIFLKYPFSDVEEEDETSSLCSLGKRTRSWE